MILKENGQGALAIGAHLNSTRCKIASNNFQYGRCVLLLQKFGEQVNNDGDILCRNNNSISFFSETSCSSKHFYLEYGMVRNWANYVGAGVDLFYRHFVILPIFTFHFNT